MSFELWLFAIKNLGQTFDAAKMVFDEIKNRYSCKKYSNRQVEPERAERNRQLYVKQRNHG